MDGECSTQYVYDLGCSAGIHIRELAPSNPDLGGAVDPDREAAFREKAADDITGLSVWASAVMLGRWVQENAELLAGKDCLELGAGTGLGGLAAAMLPTPPQRQRQRQPLAEGAADPAAASSVCLSDFADATMANLRHNIGANCTAGSGNSEGHSEGHSEGSSRSSSRRRGSTTSCWVRTYSTPAPTPARSRASPRSSSDRGASSSLPRPANAQATRPSSALSRRAGPAKNQRCPPHGVAAPSVTSPIR